MLINTRYQEAARAVESMSNIWNEEGGITHFVLSKVVMDKETSQCEAVPDIETAFDFYGIYAYTKEGTCYNVWDTATNTQLEYKEAHSILRSLNNQLTKQ